MSVSVRDILARALEGEAHESTIDIDDVERRGKRRVHRRWAVTGGGVAAAVSLAVALPVLATPTPQQKDPTGSLLPKLDSDKVYTREYDWDDKRQNAETKQYTEAFWGWFESQQPGTEYVLGDHMDESDAYMGEDGDHPVPDEFPPLVSTRFGVSVDGERDIHSTFAEDEPGFDMPVYWLRSTAPPYEGEKIDGPLIQLPDAPAADELQVTVFPPGGFTKGTDAPRLDTFKGGDDVFDLIGCEDYFSPGDGETTVDQTVTIDCESTKDKYGRPVIQSVWTQKEKDNPDPGATRVENTVVLYRNDGSAVVVRDIPESEEEKKSKPSLSTKDLTDLAAALPENKVH